jgi:hypothetical protein
MTESEYTTHLRGKFSEKYPGCFWYKIPDAFGMDGQKRPFDAFAIHPETGMVCIESKIHKTLSPFSFSKVETHQISSLRLARHNGARSYLVIGIRCITKKYDRKILDQNIARVSADIWIDVNHISGEKADISIKALKIRELLKESELKGNRINEIYLSEERFKAYIK